MRRPLHTRPVNPRRDDRSGIRKDTDNSQRAREPPRTYNSSRYGIHTHEREGNATMPKMVNSRMTNTAYLGGKRRRPVFAQGVATAMTLVTLLALAALPLAPPAGAQGSRRDDIIFGTTGHPVAGATVRV